MNASRSGGWYDPRTGGEAVVVDALTPDTIAAVFRSNRFAIYWIASGEGTFWADLAEHPFGPESLLFFVPYQRVRLLPRTRLSGALLQFHANFLCVETFHAETGCSGNLFNNPFVSPAVALDAEATLEVPYLIDRLQAELRGKATGHTDAALAYLKLLLIIAARLKSRTTCRTGVGEADPRHPQLAALKDLVERSYRTHHAPADYAAFLNITPKSLNRLVRLHLGTTMTALIRERVLIHAKWELLHTLRPVKEIAAELGFADELYFSRMFKKATGCSPTYFREFETAIRGGSNLSMSLAKAPIPPRSSR